MRRFLMILLTMLFVGMAVASSGCGGHGGEGQYADAELEEGWIYDPEYLELDFASENVWPIKASGDFLYYIAHGQDGETGRGCAKISRLTLSDGSREELQLKAVGGDVWNYEVKEDGSVYTIMNFWGGEEQYVCLVKFDAVGEEVYRTDIGKILEEVEYISCMAADGKGRVYLAGNNSRVFLFDEKGKYEGSAAADGKNGGSVICMGEGRDGKVYVGMVGMETCLKEIDFENKKMGAAYKGFSGSSGNRLSIGLEKDFLVYDGSAVYDYDLAENTAEKLFSWKEYLIDDSLVRFVWVTSDGRVAALLNDWTTEDYSVALMKRTGEQDAKPLKKETIVLALYSADPTMKSAVAQFNKQSDKYRVELREYLTSRNPDMEEVREQINTDITSDKCPDLISLDMFEEENIGKLSAKGLFEDIGPYLEQSGKLNREDFVENLIEGNIYRGKLIAIPRVFYVKAFVVSGSSGSSDSELEAGQGFGLDDLFALADRHPGAELFLYPENAMYYCMYCNQDAFVDWDTGKCSFDSWEFIRILKFAKRFCDVETDTGVTTVERAHNGGVFVGDAFLERFETAQYYRELFGEDAVFVGYPTLDGSVAFPMQMYNRYAIASVSKKKEGAWEFLEFYLTMERTKFEDGFSSRKKILEEDYEKAPEVTYQTDADGEYVLDVYGEPVPILNYAASITDATGWTYEYRQTTKEEADLVRDVIRKAKPVGGYNSKIAEIISEEAEFFYHGAKSAEEVADVIQKRVQLYVSENGE